VTTTLQLLTFFPLSLFNKKTRFASSIKGYTFQTQHKQPVIDLSEPWLITWKEIGVWNGCQFT